jgi:hypothetical protein
MTTAAICATREVSWRPSFYRGEQYDSDLGLYYLRIRSPHKVQRWGSCCPGYVGVQLHSGMVIFGRIFPGIQPGIVILALCNVN